MITNRPLWTGHDLQWTATQQTPRRRASIERHPTRLTSGPCGADGPQRPRGARHDEAQSADHAPTTASARRRDRELVERQATGVAAIACSNRGAIHFRRSTANGPNSAIWAVDHQPDTASWSLPRSSTARLSRCREVVASFQVSRCRRLRHLHAPRHSAIRLLRRRYRVTNRISCGLAI